MSVPDNCRYTDPWHTEVLQAGVPAVSDKSFTSHLPPCHVETQVPVPVLGLYGRCVQTEFHTPTVHIRHWS